ncbi:PREDICTED: maspardin-like [Amphimedon queenslandica]|uniref:Maspardin n=2 Tax=Amphimedon queenslandica TaxID=400682 RepID=I1ESJ7_AMPQE|nr:PREDICTED: maspardin-like [Amphimedon queenslandica]XP_003390781.2 PREDICTED: maspardin-like [Amphimedon queenslandica]|eukprot:XP_003387733.2 PREDICTED: maspardin-like [Amphimedon queenslandica]
MMALPADPDPITASEDYAQFRSTIPQRKVVVDRSSMTWVLYDAGPRHIKSPLVCLPPVCGSADVFFKQLMHLSAKGYRVISVEYPVYWSVDEFCEGFLKLIDHLELTKIHILGASLGAFVAQKMAEKTEKSPRVASIFICNGFIDTTAFKQTGSAKAFWLMPAFMLKRQILVNLPSEKLEMDVANSIDFMVERLDILSKDQLASRLTMNCAANYVEPQRLKDVYITIMDVFDESALSTRCKEEMYKCYPDAKRAHLKTGGNFPYLSRSDEVNTHLEIHLLPFQGTRYCVKDPELVDPEEIKAARGEIELPTT